MQAGRLARSAALAFAAAWLPFSVQAAERIVSLGGSVTEILFALGEENHIVAVDQTSLYPPAAEQLPDVGYLRTLSAEPILALQPDLVLGTTHAGPATVLQQITDVGVPVTLVEDAPTADGVVSKIRLVADAVGQQSAGKALADKVAADFDKLNAVLSRTDSRPGVLFLMSVGGNGASAAGRGTAADAMIALAGGSNIITSYDGYKPLTPEATAQLDPALVVISEHGLAAAGGLENLKSRPDLSMIPAIQEGRILIFDANLLLGFGPRAPEAARELATAIHPDLAGDLAP